MNKFLLFIILFTSITLFSINSNAQKISGKTTLKEKENNETINATTTLKHQSSNNSDENKVAQQRPIQIQSKQSKSSEQKFINSNNSIDNSTTLNPLINIDFNRLPEEVQQKINSNKLTGHYLLEGIHKEFKIEVKTVQKADDLKNISEIVSTVTGYKNCEFISSGFIYLIVEPEIDTENFETALINSGIKSNFLSEIYMLK